MIARGSAIHQDRDLALVEDGPSVAAIFDIDGVLLRRTAGVALGEALMRDRWPGPVGLFHVAVGAVLYGAGVRTAYATHALAGRLLAGRCVGRVAGLCANEAHALLSAGGHQAALDRLAWHRSHGHRVVLASGTPAPIATALGARLGIADVVATPYGVEAGRYTGALLERARIGEQKMACLLELAVHKHFRLEDAYAYCNDFVDRDLLARVGHPHAVNPDRRLGILAGQRAWPTLRWS